MDNNYDISCVSTKPLGHIILLCLKATIHAACMYTSTLKNYLWQYVVAVAATTCKPIVVLHYGISVAYNGRRLERGSLPWAPL